MTTQTRVNLHVKDTSHTTLQIIRVPIPTNIWGCTRSATIFKTIKDGEPEWTNNTLMQHVTEHQQQGPNNGIENITSQSHVILSLAKLNSTASDLIYLFGHVDRLLLVPLTITF